MSAVKPLKLLPFAGPLGAVELVANLDHDPADRRVRPRHHVPTSLVSVENATAAVLERNDGPPTMVATTALPRESESPKVGGQNLSLGVLVAQVQKKARTQRQQPPPVLIAVAELREAEDYHAYLRRIVLSDSTDAAESQAQLSRPSEPALGGESSSERADSDPVGLDGVGATRSPEAASGSGVEEADDGSGTEMTDGESLCVSQKRLDKACHSGLGAAAVPTVVKTESDSLDMFEGTRDHRRRGTTTVGAECVHRCHLAVILQQVECCGDSCAVVFFGI
jgi:hypothetical protein